MFSKVEGAKLQSALQIIIVYLFIIGSGFQCLAERVCIVAFHGKETRFNIHDIGKQDENYINKVTSVKSVELKGFLQPKEVPMTPGTGFAPPTKITEVGIEQIAISPDLSLIACIYYLSPHDAHIHFEIRIYDLQKGELRHSVVISEKNHEVQWCKWKDAATLQFAERHDQQIRLIEYSTKSKNQTIVRETILPKDEFIDPSDEYRKRASEAAEDFNRMGLRPGYLFSYSESFTPSDFGYYRSGHRGAVSDDGKNSVARVSLLDRRNYLFLEDGKICNMIAFPKNALVHRLKYIGNYLAVAFEDKNRGSINFYTKQGENLFTIPGNIIVD